MDCYFEILQDSIITFINALLKPPGTDPITVTVEKTFLFIYNNMLCYMANKVKKLEKTMSTDNEITCTIA